jgi:hypothetical protein
MRRAVKAVLTAVMIGAGTAPVAAAKNACEASAAKAPPGYQRVINARITVTTGKCESEGKEA